MGSSYFKKLFTILADPDTEHIEYSDGEINSPEELKEYMFQTLMSNMQYDFGIDFNRSNVIGFASAVMADETAKIKKGA